MIINYSILNNKNIRINACYGYSDVCDIPETIDGKPVTDIAPYAFSANREVAAGGLLWCDDELYGSISNEPAAHSDNLTELPPRICGNSLKEVMIPQTVKRIGRYAFYGCEELNTIHMYSTTLDLGNGIFMGCGKVRDLHVSVDEDSRSSLHELLLMFCQSVQLRYYTCDMTGAAALKYLLIFPPYFENNDENTPARITFRDLHGSGLYYRNCFANTAFQIDRYDPLFAYAVANEEEAVTMSLALSRIIVDNGLRETDRAKYNEYILEHISALAHSLRSFFDEGLISYDELKSLLGSELITAERLSILIEDFGRMKAQDLLSLSMDIKKNRFAAKADEPVKKRRRFEL